MLSENMCQGIGEESNLILNYGKKKKMPCLSFLTAQVKWQIH